MTCPNAGQKRPFINLKVGLHCKPKSPFPELGRATFSLNEAKSELEVPFKFVAINWYNNTIASGGNLAPIKFKSSPDTPAGDPVRPYGPTAPEHRDGTPAPSHHTPTCDPLTPSLSEYRHDPSQSTAMIRVTDSDH